MYNHTLSSLHWPLHVLPSGWRVNPTGQLQRTPVAVSLHVLSQPPLLTAQVSADGRAEMEERKEGLLPREPYLWKHEKAISDTGWDKAACGRRIQCETTAQWTVSSSHVASSTQMNSVTTAGFMNGRVSYVHLQHTSRFIRNNVSTQQDKLQWGGWRTLRLVLFPKVTRKHKGQ